MKQEDLINEPWIAWAVSGRFEPNIETTETAYFDVNELPPLAENKNTAEQIRLCHKASRDENWELVFD